MGLQFIINVSSIGVLGFGIRLIMPIRWEGDIQSISIDSTKLVNRIGHKISQNSLKTPSLRLSTTTSISGIENSSSRFSDKQLPRVLK